MTISSTAAMWFFPFVLPICLWVAYTDLRWMKILNIAVLTLVAVFLMVGLIALPFDVYLWRLAHIAVMLALGIAINAAGLVGAGDAKFVAAAAPFVPLGDVRLVLVILAVCLIAGFIAHRAAKYSGLRRLAPAWESWDRGKKFPMGLCLGGALGFYLALGVWFGS